MTTNHCKKLRKMTSVWSLLLLFTSGLVSASHDLDYKGDCTFSCNWQNRVFTPYPGPTGVFFKISSADPTVVSVEYADRIEPIETWECIWRFNPFMVVRRFDGKVYQYSCLKFPKSGPYIKYLFRSNWKCYKDLPTICEVCDTKLRPFNIIDVEAPAKLKYTYGYAPKIDIGCTNPSVCDASVHKPKRKQVQCGQCELSDLKGGGLCCNSTRT